MINKLLKNKFFPIIFKIISLIVFLAIVIIGYNTHSTDAVLLKQLRNTNIANLLVWSYWWPLIIIASILWGRVWCMICPVELITSFAAKIGFKNRRPKWIRSGWAISIFYIIILIIGINIFAIHRNPRYMAAYLTVIVAVSFFIGIIYEKNTFCRYICPVGYLLGLYSRLSAWGWRVKDNKTCEECRDKSCINSDYQYALNTKSCGVDLYPEKIKDNSYCILCAGCLKTCKEYQTNHNSNRPNPGFIRIGFADGLYKGTPLLAAEWFFLFIVSGFVIYEIVSEFKSSKTILLFLPNYIDILFSISNTIIQSLIKSLYIFFFLPGLFWFLPYLIIRIRKNSLSFINYITHFGLAFIPIVASAHFCKAILKTTSRIPYFKYLVNDFQGIETAKGIVTKQIVLQQIPGWGEWLITIAVTLILFAGYFISIKTINKIIKKLSITDNTLTLRLMTTFYFLIFFIDVIIWRWI